MRRDALCAFVLLLGEPSQAEQRSSESGSFAGVLVQTVTSIARVERTDDKQEAIPADTPVIAAMEEPRQDATAPLGEGISPPTVVPASFVQCVSASNPTCPENVCPSMKECPIKPSAEPIVWGPTAWHFLHTSSVNYPVQAGPEHKAHCRKFLEGLPFMLPCGDCGQHLKEYFSDKPAAIQASCESRATLVALMVDIHNDVNQKLGKPTSWTSDQAHEEYSSTRVCVKNGETWPAAKPLE